MKLLFPVLFSLCLLSCIDEYSDTIELYADGSAVFRARLYPCEPDSALLSGIREDYDSVPGVSFDSAWFVPKDSAYSLNFKVSFENLLAWQGNEKIEKDFVGAISLKKTDSNTYAFERVINAGAENKDGNIVPEDNISELIVGQIVKTDSSFWEYSLTLPAGATLRSSEPVDTAYIKQNENTLRWKIPAGEAVAKRIVLKAEYSMPDKKPVMSTNSLIGIAVGCAIMLLAIIMLIGKLRKLSAALNNLKTAEKAYQNPLEPENEQSQDGLR